MSNRDIMENSMGYNGAEFISDTVQHTSGTDLVYTCLHLLADTVISQINGSITGNTITGVVLSEGVMLYGRFKSITLTSGKVLAYKGV